MELQQIPRPQTKDQHVNCFSKKLQVTVQGMSKDLTCAIPKYEKSPPARAEVQTTGMTQNDARAKDTTVEPCPSRNADRPTRPSYPTKPRYPTPAAHAGRRPAPALCAGGRGPKGKNAVEYIFYFKRELPVPKQSGLVDSVPRPGSERHLANPSRTISEESLSPQPGVLNGLPDHGRA